MRGLVPRPIHKGGVFMINRRIMIFGLIGLMVLSLVTLGKKLVTKDITEIPQEMEIVSSDDSNFLQPEIVEDDGMRKTVMYFQDDDGYLVPVMRRIPWEEGIAKTTISNMIDSAELRDTLGSTGLKPIIPAGTKINGMTIDESGVCKVDFSSEIKNKENKTDEENLIKGVVYTLTEFPSVKSVKVLVDGKEMDVLNNGTSIAGNLTRENINLLGKTEEGRSNVLVYFKGSTDADFDYFVPVTIPTMAPMANVYTALDLLFEGPPVDKGLSSDIPSDVDFQGVEIKEGTAYVDINLGAESLLTKETTINELIKNIGLTLGQFDEINSVEVLVDGEIINSAIPVFANEY